MAIDRAYFLDQISQEFKVHSVCGLLGPRQCGKTTLSLQYAAQFSFPVHTFDCENPIHLTRLEDPLTALESLDGLIVIDEVQRRPDLFPVLRVLVDRYPEKRFLITGSASRDLIAQSSETLAGRIGYIQLSPFSIDEVSDWRQLWHRGGFPKSYLAVDEASSLKWRDSYIQSFLERDVAQLGFDIMPRAMGQLWRMLAHMNGQILNVHKLAEAIDVDKRTINRYLSILEGTFMITLLRPWHTNLGKREVKSPKVYIRDSGLLFRLLSLKEDQIPFYPDIGAAFEGFAVEMIQRKFQCYENLFFWNVHSGAELDLVFVSGQKKIGIEVKMTDHPRITKSMHQALGTLGLDRMYLIIAAQTKPFFLDADKKVSCLNITDIGQIDFEN